jgi:hypothetical protein
MPGMVPTNHFFGFADPALVVGPVVFFTALVFGLVATRAHDRARLRAS